MSSRCPARGAEGIQNKTAANDVDVQLRRLIFGKARSFAPIMSGSGNFQDGNRRNQEKKNAYGHAVHGEELV